MWHECGRPPSPRRCVQEFCRCGIGTITGTIYHTRVKRAAAPGRCRMITCAHPTPPKLNRPRKTAAGKPQPSSAMTPPAATAAGAPRARAQRQPYTLRRPSGRQPHRMPAGLIPYQPTQHGVESPVAGPSLQAVPRVPVRPNPNQNPVCEPLRVGTLTRGAPCLHLACAARGARTGKGRLCT